MMVSRCADKLRTVIKSNISDSGVETIRKKKIQWYAFWAYLRHKKVNNSRIDRDGKVKIVFIVFSPQSWNSLKTVYLAARKNIRVVTHVIVLPYDTIGPEGESISSYTYFAQECPEAVEAYENGILLDLKEIQPDIVFRQSPYDNFYPKEYSYDQLAKYTKVCYVPYNYNSSPLKHLKIEYSDVMLRNVYAIFTDNISNMEYCLKRKEEVKWYKGLNVYYLGFPRFDLYTDINQNQSHLQKEKENNICYTWMPRWSTDSIYNDATGFFDYCEHLIRYFGIHRELMLIIRPHPMMFSNFIEKGLMSEEAVAKFRRRLVDFQNICLDNHLDYMETFLDTDVLIADLSSLNVEFFITGKPIIYCGNVGEFNRETRGMVELFYKVSNWDEMKLCLDQLALGFDQNKEKRYDAIQEFLKEIPENIGEAILNECLKFA